MQAGTAPDPSPSKRPRGRPRKTLEQRDDGNRRRALLRSAARLFRRKGFDATTTRDIASAVGMHSGSPFYHFASKGELLFTVMEEGMRSAIARQSAVLQKVEQENQHWRAVLALLIRNHFEILLGPGNDFIPVMLYEARSIGIRQRHALARLQSEYEAAWIPALEGLHRTGELRAEPRLARLLIFGALNWSAQWYDRKKGATLDQLTEAAMALFIGEKA